MQAQLCHECSNCTTFSMTFLGCYAEIWVFPPQPGFAGAVDIIVLP
jgi:hypothetical protein